MVRLKNVLQGLNGMYLYINTDEPNSERPHIHVSRGTRKKKGDLKYWLDSRDFDPKTTRGFTSKELSKLRATLEIYHEECVDQWQQIYLLRNQEF